MAEKPVTCKLPRAQVDAILDEIRHWPCTCRTRRYRDSASRRSVAEILQQCAACRCEDLVSWKVVQ